MASRRRKKKPKAVIEPGAGKQPRTAGLAGPPSQVHPSWRSGLLQTAGPYGWHELDRKKLFEVHEKLRGFESQTWHEILIDGKQRNHYVEVTKLAPEARKRLQELRLDDIDELVSLRLSARERIWGILESGVLKLLWWDPQHRVCPSKKRHT